MSVATIRTKLATAVANISSLKVYTTWPLPVPGEYPCFIVWPKLGNWDANLPRTLPVIRWEGWLITGRQGRVEDAQITIDGYLDTSGANSVKAAIEGYANYSPDCNYARVIGWTDYGGMDVDQIPLFHVKFEIETR